MLLLWCVECDQLGLRTRDPYAQVKDVCACGFPSLRAWWVCSWSPYTSLCPTSQTLSVLNEAWSRFGQGDLALKELGGQAQSGRWVGKAVV